MTPSRSVVRVPLLNVWSTTWATPTAETGQGYQQQIRGKPCDMRDEATASQKPARIDGTRQFKAHKPMLRLRTLTGFTRTEPTPDHGELIYGST